MRQIQFLRHDVHRSHLTQQLFHFRIVSIQFLFLFGIHIANALGWGAVTVGGRGVKLAPTSRVTEPDALLDTALDLAREIAKGAPLAIRAAREILRATEALEVSAGYALMRSGAVPVYRQMLDSEDALEGPRAFAEGRAPRWLGR